MLTGVTAHFVYFLTGFCTYFSLEFTISNLQQICFGVGYIRRSASKISPPETASTNQFCSLAVIWQLAHRYGLTMKFSVSDICTRIGLFTWIRTMWMWNYLYDPIRNSVPGLKFGTSLLTYDDIPHSPFANSGYLRKSAFKKLTTPANDREIEKKMAPPY